MRFLTQVELSHVASGLQDHRATTAPLLISLDLLHNLSQTDQPHGTVLQKSKLFVRLSYFS